MAVLGSLIEQVRGVSYKPEDLHSTLNESSITLLRANNIKDGKLNFDDVVYVDRKKVSEKQILQAGDILICASSGSKELVGKAAYVECNLPMTFGAFCKVVRPKTDYPQYIGHFFNSPYYRERIANSAAGANINNIRNEHIDVLEIVWPSMEEQHSAVTILDKVTGLITLRKEQLEKLDQLVKSRFIELFGDPIRNTQNRPTTDFINVVKMQRGFDLPVQDRQQDGDIPVFGSNGALDRHNVAKVQGGGVITGRSGTIGKVYYTEGDYWPLNTSLFSVDTHGNNIIYLAYLLQMYDLSRFTEGTGVPTLNRNKFHDKPIIDVPLNEQEQFAVFVKQTDKSKLAIQQSLDKLELLKKSLMQEYFG